MAADALASTYVTLDVGGTFLKGARVDGAGRAECSFALAELGSDAGVVGAARVAMVGLTG